MSRLILPSRKLWTPPQRQRGFVVLDAYRFGGGGDAAVAFNPSDKNVNITLSGSDATAGTITTGGSWYVTSLPSKYGGKWIVEFDIDSMPATTGSIAIGIAETPAQTNTKNGGYPGATRGFTWWVRKSSAGARFYYSYTGYDTLTPATDSFDTGDIVTITFDFATKVATVYRNGTMIYSKTVSTIDSSFVYAPIAKLYGSGSAYATVTLRSTIAYPVAGYTPWA